MNSPGSRPAFGIARSRALKALLHRLIRTGSLEVETAAGERYHVGDGGGVEVGVRFTDGAAEGHLMADPEMALGELYTDGRMILTKGTLVDLLTLGVGNYYASARPGWLRLLDAGRVAARHVVQWNDARKAQRNVAHHYDLDARLYRLFLDDDLQYSCAYFEHPGQSLEDAQRAKKRHIAAKLLLKPGQNVLDIGCGFGGMAITLAQDCGVRARGVTLSQAQFATARKRAVELEGRADVSFALEDYRDIEGPFDRIVSVGMFEHVGMTQYGTFFRKAADLLTDDGVMLLHAIGRSDGPGATNPWITKYIFPGGHIPALSEALPEIEKAGLMVTDIEILRLHYAETLRHWRERFEARREEARALYDERFCRMWEFYLAGSESTFRASGQMVFQIQMAKRHGVVPVTRNYIGEAEAQLRMREKTWRPMRAAGE